MAWSDFWHMPRSKEDREKGAGKPKGGTATKIRPKAHPPKSSKVGGIETVGSRDTRQKKDIFGGDVQDARRAVQTAPQMLKEGSMKEWTIRRGRQFFNLKPEGGLDAELHQKVLDWQKKYNKSAGKAGPIREDGILGEQTSRAMGLHDYRRSEVEADKPSGPAIPPRMIPPTKGSKQPLAGDRVGLSVDPKKPMPNAGDLRYWTGDANVKGAPPAVDKIFNTAYEVGKFLGPGKGKGKIPLPTGRGTAKPPGGAKPRAEAPRTERPTPPRAEPKAEQPSGTARDRTNQQRAEEQLRQNRESTKVPPTSGKAKPPVGKTDTSKLNPKVLSDLRGKAAKGKINMADIGAARSSGQIDDAQVKDLAAVLAKWKRENLVTPAAAPKAGPKSKPAVEEAKPEWQPPKAAKKQPEPEPVRQQAAKPKSAPKSKATPPKAETPPPAAKPAGRPSFRSLSEQAKKGDLKSEDIAEAAWNKTITRDQAAELRAMRDKAQTPPPTASKPTKAPPKSPPKKPKAKGPSKVTPELRNLANKATGANRPLGSMPEKAGVRMKYQAGGKDVDGHVWSAGPEPGTIWVARSDGRTFDLLGKYKGQGEWTYRRTWKP